MAAAMRPSVLRQACNLASTTRAFSTRSSPSSAFRLATPLKQSPIRSAFVPFVSTRVAAFHASSRNAILPPLPQTIQGTLNDPAPVPPSSPTHGSYHWTFERIIATGLIPMTLAPFAAGSLNPVLDSFLISLILIHSHVGFESSITDYFPKYRVPGWRTFLMWVLRASTVAVGVAFYEFETNDVGLTEGLKRIWQA